MYRSILVPVDLSDKLSWRKALPTAIQLAEIFEGQIHLITVIPGFPLPIVGQYFPGDFEPRLRQQAAKQLKDFAAEQVPDTVSCKRIIAEGKVYQEILAAAEKIKSDLIVMGSHRPELRDFLLGPNAQKVVQHAHCSVMVVRD
jgi:nucleotide-binding universal stress UspA family protein